MNFTKDFRKRGSRTTHLEMIQGVISRMGANSLQCKTWAMTIFAALSVIILGSDNSRSVLFASPCVIIILIVFWWLDAWYLQMERLFRHLYDDIRTKDLPENFAEVEDPYNMSFKGYTEQSVLRIMFSRSAWPVYLVPILITFTMWVAFVIVCLLKNAIIWGSFCQI